MEIKIFYSWQSDTPSKYNRNFIEEALTKAIKKIKKDTRFKFNDIIIDRDTKNVPGTPSIPPTVEGKIEEASIFLADLTIIDNPNIVKRFRFKWLMKLFLGTDYYEHITNKKINPNSNVVFELGQAFSVLKFQRVICVMNNYYGKASTENLPFDFVQKRWPISYDFSVKNRDEKLVILEDLSNNLVQAIQETLEFGLANPFLKNYPFLEWDQWAKEFPTEIEFFTTEKLVQHMETIQRLAKEENSILRIIGLSGLGKTRLVFEALQPTAAVRHELYKKVLYLNLSSCESDYLKIIRQLSESDQNKILIIDNCDIKTHQTLLPIIRKKNCHLSLITIDYNPIGYSWERSSDFNLIEINPDDYEEVINSILLKFFPQNREKDERETIKRFVRGHTFIATILALSKKHSPEIWIPLINKTDLIEKLLGDEGKNDEMRKMLIAISIFEKLGHFEELMDQSAFVATNKLITQLDLSPELALISFNKTCQHYLRRGLIERQARYIMIRTKPLALTLAVEWWKACTADHAKKLLTSFKNKHELKEALCDQLKHLDFLENAKEIIQDFCDPEGPFGNAEVLNTEEGSRLFRSLVEVNPEATSNALFRIFGSMEKKDLFDIDAGRRNLVWSLEKLCFRKETFEKSAKILMAFGIAENETDISNNSRGQFFQLFQAYLPGTQASLKERISIIEYALNKKDAEYDEIAIGALFRAIHTGSFYRMGGPDKQGSSAPLIDYQPNFRELSDYWKYSLEKLFEISSSTKTKKESIFLTIINSIRGFYKERCGHLILPIVQKIISQDQDSWFDIRTNLKMTLKFEERYLNPEEKTEIFLLVEKLEPTEFTSKYKNYVKKNYWDYSEEAESITEVTNQRAFDLADQFINEKLPFDKYLPMFFEGEQHLGYFFGRRLGEILNTTEDNFVFAAMAIVVMKSIPVEIRNVSVYTGFLFNQKDKGLKLKFFKNISDDVDLQYISFHVASMIEPSMDIISTLFTLVDTAKAKVLEFKKFQFGHSLSNLTVEEIIQFGEKLIDNYGKEGSQTSLSVLFAYSWSDDQKWGIVKDAIRRALMTRGLFEQEEPDVFDKFHWSESVTKILSKSNDVELVHFLNTEIIEFSSKTEFISSMEFEFKKVMQVFLDDYFETVWPDLSNAILSEKEKHLTYYNLHNILGSHIGSIGNDIGILFTNNLDQIFDWAKKVRNVAPIRLANMTPIYNYSEGNVLVPSWHPFTKKLIDEFGNDDGFLEELSANMGTYSWTGSLVPLLQAEKAIMAELKSHKLEKVKNWANKKLHYIDDAIRVETNMNIELYL